jgi:hypothetical protein
MKFFSHLSLNCFYKVMLFACTSFSQVFSCLSFRTFFLCHLKILIHYKVRRFFLLKENILIVIFALFVNFECILKNETFFKKIAKCETFLDIYINPCVSHINF